MCEYTLKFYDCRCKTYTVNSFCQRYIKTRGHTCKAETHVFREECHPGEICPRHRNVMTDNHRNYIKKIYKNLNKTHPDRNWKGIKTAARRPSPKKPTFVG